MAMSANEREDNDLIILHVVESSQISFYVDTTIAFILSFERVVSQNSVLRVAFEQF